MTGFSAWPWASRGFQAENPGSPGKFRSENHLLCDNFGHIDGATWRASRRDLVTFGDLWCAEDYSGVLPGASRQKTQSVTAREGLLDFISPLFITLNTVISDFKMGLFLVFMLPTVADFPPVHFICGCSNTMK